MAKTEESEQLVYINFAGQFKYITDFAYFAGCFFKRCKMRISCKDIKRDRGSLK